MRGYGNDLSIVFAAQYVGEVRVGMALRGAREGRVVRGRGGEGSGEEGKGRGGEG